MWRLRHLVNDSIQSQDDATYSVDLPESGALHALLVRVACTNGATAGRARTPFDIADLVRVVGNGEERFYELQPVEIEKWMELFLGRALPMVHTEAAGAVQSVVFPIYFGRRQYDPEFFLPLSRIKDPRLEVAYSPSIAADGGFATGTTTFNVMAIWSPDTDRLNYRGTLVTRTLKSVTSVASGDDSMDVDINDPIRAIGIYCYEANTADDTDITRVRLEANSGEFDIWAADWRDLRQENQLYYGANITHVGRLLAQNDDTFDVRLGDIQHISLTNFFASDVTADTFVIASVDGITGDRLTLDTSIADVTAGAETHIADATDRAYLYSVRGIEPSFFAMLHWHDLDDVAGYLNPRAYDKLKLVLTQGGAGGTIRNAVQYLKQVG